MSLPKLFDPFERPTATTCCVLKKNCPPPYDPLGGHLQAPHTPGGAPPPFIRAPSYPMAIPTPIPLPHPPDLPTQRAPRRAPAFEGYLGGGAGAARPQGEGG